MPDNPAVSVVIPLYNKGPYITRALNSVLSQSFQDFEIIVVDDGSDDDGSSKVDEFRNSKILLIRQENKGVSSARNKGVDVAKSELIAFLDADDEWLPEHLDTLIRLRKNYPEAAALGTTYYYKSDITDEFFEPVIKHIPRKPWEGIIPNYFKAATLGDPPITASTVGILKKVLMNFRFNEDVWWGEDTDLWGRIALEYPIAFSWEGGGIYHIDAENRACDSVKPMEPNIFVFNARCALDSGDVPPELIRDLIEYTARKQIQTACKNLAASRPDLARNNLKNCSTRYFFMEKYWVLFWACFPSRIYFIFKALLRKTV